jgi:Fic family protein
MRRRLRMDIGDLPNAAAPLAMNAEGLNPTLTPAERHVEGVVELMLDATQKYDLGLSAERLFGWHAALLPTGRTGMLKITVGGSRTEQAGPIQVVSGPLGRERVHFEAPAAKRLQTEMKAFLDWFNTGQGQDPVVKAALAHLWFVIIHPFEDGNGRIARAIADLAAGTARLRISLTLNVGENDVRALLDALIEETGSEARWLGDS